MKKLITTIIAFAVMIGGNMSAQNTEIREPYGVFLSIDNTEMKKLEGYGTVVIDAQYFTAGDIAQLHEDGHTVYSYINIGSVENFRDYYSDYESLFLGEYENWEEEQWIDTSDEGWQKFITETLAGEMIEKGIDGFWVDNCDVCYFYNEEKIHLGTEKILLGLMEYDKGVIINSGDTFLDGHYGRLGRIDDVITGINQETVFSSIDFDNEQLGKQNSEDSEYYREYIEKYSALGADVYLLEYSTDKTLIDKIEKYCNEKGYHFYVSNSIELD